MGKNKFIKGQKVYYQFPFAYNRNISVYCFYEDIDGNSGYFIVPEDEDKQHPMTIPLMYNEVFLSESEALQHRISILSEELNILKERLTCLPV